MSDASFHHLTHSLVQFRQLYLGSENTTITVKFEKNTVEINDKENSLEISFDCIQAKSLPEIVDLFRQEVIKFLGLSEDEINNFRCEIEAQALLETSTLFQKFKPIFLGGYILFGLLGAYHNIIDSAENELKNNLRKFLDNISSDLTVINFALYLTDQKTEDFSNIRKAALSLFEIIFDNKVIIESEM